MAQVDTQPSTVHIGSSKVTAYDGVANYYDGHAT